jgi:hypothetical protein
MSTSLVTSLQQSDPTNPLRSQRHEILDTYHGLTHEKVSPIQVSFIFCSVYLLKTDEIERNRSISMTRIHRQGLPEYSM